MMSCLTIDPSESGRLSRHLPTHVNEAGTIVLYATDSNDPTLLRPVAQSLQLTGVDGPSSIIASSENGAIYGDQAMQPLLRQAAQTVQDRFNSHPDSGMYKSPVRGLYPTIRRRHIVKDPSTGKSLVIRPEANLQGANLQGANLQEADLLEANLYRANLTKANLTEANLTEANLTGANLTEANLTGANLTGANLQEANLQEANLRFANLQEANLRLADLQGAKLQWSDLQGVNLQKADLREAKLEGANLQGANLQGATYDMTTQWPQGFNPKSKGAKISN